MVVTNGGERADHKQKIHQVVDLHLSPLVKTTKLPTNFYEQELSCTTERKELRSRFGGEDDQLKV